MDSMDHGRERFAALERRRWWRCPWGVATLERRTRQGRADQDGGLHGSLQHHRPHLQDAVAQACVPDYANHPGQFPIQSEAIPAGRLHCHPGGQRQHPGRSRDLPLVSVVMPIKNEAQHLAASLKRLNAQSYPRERLEILIVDGGSTDGTLDLVQKLMAQDRRIRLFGGKDVNCPLAMNIGIEQAHGEFIAKVDGHGYVNEDFIHVAIEHLLAHEALACVGGQIIPVGESAIAQSNKYARFSRFGVGSGVYTANISLQEVDTVQCGIYRKTDLVAVGMFDPALQFGEDEEVNYRLIQTGKKILYHSKMQFFYYIRPTFKSLFKQYFNYGRARVKVVQKHPGFIRLKHCVPSAMILALFVSGFLLALGGTGAILGMATISVYMSFLLGAAVRIGLRHRFMHIYYLVMSLLCLHWGYGLGMIRGLMPPQNQFQKGKANVA